MRSRRRRRPLRSPRCRAATNKKVIIARWLNADARILLMDEPTRGIDVAARSEIYGHMYRLRRRGKTILFASSEHPRSHGVADRIVVMREGRIAAIMERAAATPDRLLRLALPRWARRLSMNASIQIVRPLRSAISVAGVGHWQGSACSSQTLRVCAICAVSSCP